MRRISVLLLILMGVISCNRPYDVIIRQGRIADGRGTPLFQADLALRKGKIARIGSIPLEEKARLEVDASGLVVAPGFMDIHTHAERNLLRFPLARNYVSQGVTTVIGGNCGASPFPVGTFIHQVDSIGVAVNIGLLVGHNTIRRQVMGVENRPPTSAELEQMKKAVRRAMEAGCFGLSTGLKYVPGAYATTQEIVELAKVVGRYHGIYASHIRDEGLGLFSALREALTIGRETRVPVEISHLKAMGKSMWGVSPHVLALLDSARAAGVDVTFDQYPYVASSTGLTVLLPPWALEGGREKYVHRWKDPGIRRKIKAAIVHNLKFDRGGGDPATVVVIESSSDSSIVGKNLSEITSQFFHLNDFEHVAETVLQLLESGRHSCIYHAMNEMDVRQFLQSPIGMIASDSHTVSPDERLPHPRNYGTFPRVLARYVREQHLFSLAEAIHKMTGAVARRLGLKTRGTITAGNWADLVLFDPVTIQDRADWKQSRILSSGIRWVFVNGVLVWNQGKSTNARPGKFLKREE